MSDSNVLSKSLWQMQLHLRKNSMVLPIVLLVISTILVLHEHMTSEELNLRTFVTLVLATMLPLAYIDVAISSRSDPIGILCTFGGKVLLMHCSFLFLRFRLLWYPGVFYFNLQNVLGFIACTVALLAGFRMTVCAKDTRDIGIIVLLVVFAAVATELLTWGLHLAKHYHRELMLEMLGTAAEYAEIMAFVPAVWTVFRSDKKDAAPMKVRPQDAQVAAMAFFTFLISFYLFEDVISALFTFSSDPVAAFAHILHFLLLGDVATFLLIYAFNPDKTNTTILRRFSDAWLGECCV